LVYAWPTGTSAGKGKFVIRKAFADNNLQILKSGGCKAAEIAKENVLTGGNY